MLAIAPGPAMSGIARGKTLTSARSRASSSSSRVSRSWAASTMPTAMRKSRMPPAIRKASMLIPSFPRSHGPPRAKKKRTPPADDDGAARDPSLLRLRTVAGQGQEHRRDPDRVHDHEEGQERAEGELDHRKAQKKTRTATIDRDTPGQGRARGAHVEVLADRQPPRLLQRTDEP